MIASAEDGSSSGVKNVVRRDTAADSESIPGVSTIVLARRLRDGPLDGEPLDVLRRLAA